MEEKELLEYARKYYPIGTQYVPAHVTNGINEVINIDYDYSRGSNEYIHVGSKYVELDYNNCIYADGKWAKVVKKTDPMLEIQRQAKEKFPIGCTFINTQKNAHVLLNHLSTYEIHDNQIYAHNGGGLLYNNGKWATIHNEPIKQPEIIKHPEPINYEALQDKAWEIYKNVKEGDSYISTRGNKHTALRNAKKSPGSNNTEYNCWVDCGPGFLWEIKNGKELFATLLPKEEIEPEKWVPKVGDWVVSLVDRGDYRNKGDVFQVLRVNNDCLYYKEDVNGDIKTFRPAEPHEISGGLIDSICEKISGKLELDLDFPKAFPLTPEQCIEPTIKSNTQEEIKIEIKKSKTIKI